MATVCPLFIVRTPGISGRLGSLSTPGIAGIDVAAGGSGISFGSGSVVAPVVARVVAGCCPPRIAAKATNIAPQVMRFFMTLSLTNELRSPQRTSGGRIDCSGEAALGRELTPLLAIGLVPAPVCTLASTAWDTEPVSGCTLASMLSLTWRTTSAWT